MAVSDSERAYIQRIGDIKARLHAEAAAAHRALPVAQRLARSMAFTLRFLATESSRVDDPGPFYERARRLGLYEP